MDFTAKNFRYVTTGFGDFARRVEQGDKVYLRALSYDKPTEKPAVLAEDFPVLEDDFVLPAQLSLVADSLFSSVLRLSGPVNMWLHYDVSCGWVSISATCFFFVRPSCVDPPCHCFPPLIAFEKRLLTMRSR